MQATLPARRLGIIIITAMAALVIAVAAAHATAGAYHDGGINPGVIFCAPGSGTCDIKTRDGYASWPSGFFAYTGAWRPDLNGWVGYSGGSSGYGSYSTYSNVYAECGNNDSNQHSIYCYTNNL